MLTREHFEEMRAFFLEERPPQEMQVVLSQSQFNQLTHLVGLLRYNDVDTSMKRERENDARWSAALERMRVKRRRATERAWRMRKLLYL